MVKNQVKLQVLAFAICAGLSYSAVAQEATRDFKIVWSWNIYPSGHSRESVQRCFPHTVFPGSMEICSRDIQAETRKGLHSSSVLSTEQWAGLD